MSHHKSTRRLAIESAALVVAITGILLWLGDRVAVLIWFAILGV